MNRRPLGVTIIGWLFIAVGVVGVSYHATEIRLDDAFQPQLIGVLALRLLAIVCGVFVLRGHNWARWLLLAWMAYHVVLSGFHAVSQLVVHGLLLVVITYFLFNRKASPYFLPVRARDTANETNL